MSYTPLDGISVNITSDGTSPATDAFSRIRVSNPYTVFESKFDYPDHDATFPYCPENRASVSVR